MMPQPVACLALALTLRLCGSARQHTPMGTDPADYEEAYDHLYDDKQYHADLGLTHESETINMVQKCMMTPGKKHSLKTVLVLGCSHGLGAQMLHNKAHVNVWGVDVAHKAIEMANRERGNTCGAVPCFRQGSLMKIPYGKRAFDAGMSADVLEHIAPGDVPQVVRDISRVVKYYLFVSIANFKERSRNGEKAGMRNVHLTVEGPKWWADAFSKEGWHVVEDTSTNDYVKLSLSRE